MDAVVKALEHRNAVLVVGATGSGQEELFNGLGSRTGRTLVVQDCNLLVGDSSASSENKFRHSIAQAKERNPCILVLQNVDKLACNRDGKTDHRVLDRLSVELNNLASQEIYVIANSNEHSIPQPVTKIFPNRINIEDLTESERFQTLKWLCLNRSLVLNRKVKLREVAQKCSGYVFEDLSALVIKATFNRDFRIKKTRCKADTFLFKIDKLDFDKALTDLQHITADAIGAPTIPKVNWEDVGEASLFVVGSNTMVIDRKGSQVLTDEPGHGKSPEPIAAEDLGKRLIRHDEPSITFVLEIVLVDVVPKLAHYATPMMHKPSHHGSQLW